MTGKLPTRYWSIATLALTLFAQNASAAVEIRGFGSATAVKVDSPFNWPNYGTHGQAVDVSNSSKVGLNFNSSLGDDFSATVQLIFPAYESSVNQILDWGFVSWKPNQNFNARAGRVLAPVWLYSQSRNVGYNYVWAKLPEEVYSLNPLNSINGLSLLSTNIVGPGILQAELIAGEGEDIKSDDFVSQNRTTKTQISSALGLALSYNVNDWFLVRGFAATANVKAEIDTALTLPAGSLTGISVATTLGVPTVLNLTTAKLFEIGTKIDRDGYLFSSEYVRILTGGTSEPRASGFYAMAGKKLGHWTPHFTYSWQGDLQGSIWYHPQYPAVTTLQTGGHSWSPGLNYQMGENIVLKSEYSNSYQDYANASQNLKFNVYRLSADFIF